jgi:hypothetical protein
VKPRTHCRHGHARAEHAYQNAKGIWICRECVRTSARHQYDRFYRATEKRDAATTAKA